MKSVFWILPLLISCSSSNPLPKAEIVFDVIAKGETPDWSAHLQAGKIVVFDVYADWCAPCKRLEKSLINLAQTYPSKLVIKKCDLVSWDSNLAKENEIKDLPFLRVYDQNGKLFAHGPSNQVLPKLVQLLNGKINHG